MVYWDINLSQKQFLGVWSCIFNNNSIFDAPDSDNGMFNSDSDVILCASGYSDIKDLKVMIDPKYFPKEKLQED